MRGYGGLDRSRSLAVLEMTLSKSIISMELMISFTFSNSHEAMDKGGLLTCTQDEGHQISTKNVSGPH